MLSMSSKALVVMFVLLLALQAAGIGMIMFDWVLIGFSLVVAAPIITMVIIVFYTIRGNFMGANGFAGLDEVETVAG